MSARPPIVLVGDPDAGADLLLRVLARATPPPPVHAAAGADPATLEAAFPDARFVALELGAHEPLPASLAAQLDAAAPGRWVRASRERLLADPRSELRRLCSFLGTTYDAALLGPLEEAALRADADERRLASGSTPGFPAALAHLGASLLVTTYEANRLVVVRADRDGALNTHFRAAPKPMGVAVAPGRIALGTRTEVWELRDVPAATARLEPRDAHDACFVARHRQVTGDVAVHELAFGDAGELWLCATAFSCLATLDPDRSFVPRWTPPFVSQVAPGDRCHLNGLCVVEGAPRFVTALGRTDEPGAWRAGKADGGVLLDVASGAEVAAGLSMPHSPRVHAGRLWVLESGKGELGVVDVATGAVEVVAQLPGFTRGLAMAGDVAFVGLSQIRESSSFGDLPVTKRLDERRCGVWMIDLTTGAELGRLEFSGAIRELFDVQLLAARFPEVAEPDDAVTASTFVLP